MAAALKEERQQQIVQTSMLLAQALIAVLAQDEAKLERQRQLPVLLDDFLGRLGDLPRQVLVY
jgi:hypothetical protein